MERTEKVKLLASQWLSKARSSGLILASPVRSNLSQVERGVSIDFLAQLAASIRSCPQLPASTQSIVNNIINAATSDSKCPMVDLLPGQHVGPATAFISHAWTGVDFLELLCTLVDDFNVRWEAHKAYRSQRKTAAQVMAEESAMDKAQEEARRLQQEADALLKSAGTCTRWDEKPKGNEASQTASTGPTSPRRTVAAVAGALRNVASPDKARAANTTAAGAAGDVSGGDAQGNSPPKARLEPSSDQQDDSSTFDAPAADALPPSKLAAAVMKFSDFGSVVDAMRQQQATEELKSAGPVKNLAQAAKKIILNERAMGAGLGMSRRGTAQGTAAQKPARHSVLAKSGNLHKVRPRGKEQPASLVPPKSIYVRAQASADLTRLLQPLDEEHELVEAVMEAQRAAVAKAKAAKATVEMEELADERRQLLGYYVWIDVFALQQCRDQPNRAPDLACVSRLINVIGRTMVIVDDEWRCLSRLWCLYEIWLSVKFKAALVTLSTASALEKPTTILQNLLSPTLSKGDGTDARRMGRAGSNASVLTNDVALLDSESALSGQDEAAALMPLPASIPLMEAKATYSEDRSALLAQWAEEVASPRTQIHSVRQIESSIHAGLALAREREKLSQQLVKGVYNFLGLFSRSRRTLGGPTFQELQSARDALKNVAQQHFAKELKENKDVQVTDGDAELEMWQLMKFLAHHLTTRSEEPFWISELNRYCSVAHKAYATRFSTSYVDQLLRAAGTFDDMKVLRSYVYGQCHASIKSKREDTGE